MGILKFNENLKIVPIVWWWWPCRPDCLIAYWESMKGLSWGPNGTIGFSQTLHPQYPHSIVQSKVGANGLHGLDSCWIEFSPYSILDASFQPATEKGVVLVASRFEILNLLWIQRWCSPFCRTTIQVGYKQEWALCSETLDIYIEVDSLDKRLNS